MIDAKYLMPAIEPAKYFPTESARVEAMSANVDEIRKIKVGDIITTVHDSEYTSQTVGRVAGIEIEDMGDGYHMITVEWAEHHTIRLGKISQEFHGGSLITSGGAVFKILESAPESAPEPEPAPKSPAPRVMCEDTLAHPGNEVIPFAVIRVAESMGGVGYDEANESDHEYNVCGPCAEYLTRSSHVRVRIVEYIIPEEELRARGEITDPVPVGSNKAKPDWTGRVESPIVRAEGLVRDGKKGAAYLVAVVNEISRRNRMARRHEAAAHMNEADRQYGEGLISKAYLDVMLRDAERHTKGVSLAKA